jgi:nitroreductase
MDHMKTFLELAKTRFSLRNYLEKPVEEDKLMYVLEAARIAPSAANFQPWHFIVIRDEEMRKMAGSTYNRQWFMKAPVIILLCGDHKASWKRADGKDHCDIDIAIAADHMTLAAAEAGLGTCWVCNFDAKKTIELFNLPDHIEPVAYLSLGYPDIIDDNGARHLIRKKLEEIVHWDKF